MLDWLHTSDILCGLGEAVLLCVQHMHHPFPSCLPPGLLSLSLITEGTTTSSKQGESGNISMDFLYMHWLKGLVTLWIYICIVSDDKDNKDKFYTSWISEGHDFDLLC